MDTETFALLLVQQVTLVGLIKLLDSKGILDQDVIIEFLEHVALSNKSEEDALSPYLTEGIEAMIASIRSEQGWKPTVIRGGKE